MSFIRRQARALYLIEILHQTTTSRSHGRLTTELYLIEILHQTTTAWFSRVDRCGCILSKFYIKPQLFGKDSNDRTVVSYRNSTSNHNYYLRSALCRRVVSYRNSTSNHNFNKNLTFDEMLYLIEILHQTTTTFAVAGGSRQLYLIEILHQTTT